MPQRRPQTTHELRTALRQGWWWHLGGPLLELALLEEPDAWGPIVKACATEIALVGVERAEETCPWGLWRRWALEMLGQGAEEWLSQSERSLRLRHLLTLMERVYRRLPDEQRPAAAMHLARQVVARWPHDDLKDSLRVMNRWPV